VRKSVSGRSLLPPSHPDLSHKLPTPCWKNHGKNPMGNRSICCQGAETKPSRCASSQWNTTASSRKKPCCPMGFHGWTHADITSNRDLMGIYHVYSVKICVIILLPPFFWDPNTFHQGVL
jgi:hypothetical protein